MALSGVCGVELWCELRVSGGCVVRTVEELGLDTVPDTGLG